MAYDFVDLTNRLKARGYLAMDDELQDEVTSDTVVFRYIPERISFRGQSGAIEFTMIIGVIVWEDDDALAIKMVQIALALLEDLRALSLRAKSAEQVEIPIAEETSDLTLSAWAFTFTDPGIRL